MIKEFEELKNEYQNEADNQTKKVLRDKIDKEMKMVELHMGQKKSHVLIKQIMVVE